MQRLEIGLLVKHWFRDRHFKSLLKNSSYLAVSKVVAGIAGLAALALAGRGLGLIPLGTLILIVSYAKAASGLSKFQSWQLIVRYSGALHTDGNPAQFKAATRFALGLDISSGLGGAVLSVALLPLLGPLVGIDQQYLFLTALYCLLLPTMGAATPVGVLRSLDRFDLISWQGTSYPIARAVLVAMAFMADAPFETYLAIWFITDLGGDIFLWYLAWRELRRRDLTKGIRPTLRPDMLPGAWRFAIQVNLNASLIAAWGPIARLIVGGLLGPAAAAVYRIAASLADSAQKPSDMLAKAFYPEIVRMDLATKKPWKLMLRGTAMAMLIGLTVVLVLLLAGRQIVNLIFGSEFLAAYPVLMVLILAPLLGVLSFPLPPMLYALDRPDGPLKARLIGTVSYFLAVAPLAWEFGVAGAAAAYVLAHAAMVVTLMYLVRREHRRVRTG